MISFLMDLYICGSWGIIVGTHNSRDATITSCKNSIIHRNNIYFWYLKILGLVR